MTNTPDSPNANGAPHRKRRLRLRRLLLRLSILCFSVFLALIVGEIAVRMLTPQVLFPRYVTDSEFGIRVNVPNARYRHTSPEVKVQFRINSMGIRSDREFTFEKPPGTVRIVGLGDSFTQGYEVDLVDTYLYRLEQMLTDRGLRVEVINLGVSGYGNAEELIMLREFGFRFDPDIVIVGYFQNDPSDNIRSNLYRLDETGTPVRAAESYLPAIGIRNRLYSFGLYRWLAGNSQLFALARECLAGIVKRRMVEANTAASASVIRAEAEGASKAEAGTRANPRSAVNGEVHPHPSTLAGTAGAAPYSPSARDYSQLLTARLLDEIKRECTRRDVSFLLLDIPGTDLSSNLPATLLKRITPREIVRTAPALRAEGPGAYLYRRQGHSHWTPRAHEIAAKRLTDALVPEIKEPADNANASTPTP